MTGHLHSLSYGDNSVFSSQPVPAVRPHSSDKLSFVWGWRGWRTDLTSHCQVLESPWRRELSLKGSSLINDDKTETEDSWTLSSLLLCSGIFRQSVISRIIKIDIPDLFFGVTELTDLLTETLGSDTTRDSGAFIVFLLFRPRSDTIFSPRFWLWPAAWMLSFFDWFLLRWLWWLWSSQSCRAGT